MALKRRRNTTSQSIDSARTSSYAGVRGIRRIDPPTDKTSVYGLKNFDIDDDNALVVRDPILLYKNKPTSVQGFVYKIVYSFDGNREKDLYISNYGIYNIDGTLLPIIYKDNTGKSITLNYRPFNLNAHYDCIILPEVTYATYATSNVINNIKVRTPEGDVFRFVRYTIVNNEPVLEVLNPAVVNLERSNFVYNPDFYSDIFQDVRDNYEAQVFDVLGVLQYVLYDHTTEKIVTPQLTDLKIKTLLRSSSNQRYTLTSAVPEGTGIYLKAFVDIKKYPKTKVYCTWEESLDGVYYNTCPEFKNKFSDYLIDLKIKKDEVDVNAEFKTLNVTPFELFSDEDYVDNRPDVLFVNADNKLRRFVIYILPTYEEVEGFENPDVLDDVATLPADTQDVRDAIYYEPSSVDQRNYGLAVIINRGLSGVVYPDSLKINLSHYTATQTKAVNDKVVKLKNNLIKASVLQKNKTTKYNLNTTKWFVRAKVEYLINGNPSVQYEYLKTAGGATELTGDIASLLVNSPQYPHIVRDIVVTSYVEKPKAIYPWNIKNVPGHQDVSKFNNINSDGSLNHNIYGDGIDLNLESNSLKDDKYNMYFAGFSQSVTNYNLLSGSLAGFTLSNINEIDHNAINAYLEVSNYNVTLPSVNVYEQITSPVVSPYLSNAALYSAIDAIRNNTYGNTTAQSATVFSKPSYSLINKNRANSIIVPKQEITFSKVYNSDIYGALPSLLGTSGLKNINYLFTKEYKDWLSLASKDELELGNCNFTTGTKSGYTITYGFDLLTKKEDTADTIIVDSVLKFKETQTEHTYGFITIEKPKISLKYDSCYTIENDTEHVYSDVSKIVMEGPSTTTTYYAGGNEYIYNVGTSETSLIAKTKHIAYINKNLINPLKVSSSLDHISILSDTLEVDTDVIDSPAKAQGLLNYRKSLYAYSNSGFKNNVLVSNPGSIEFKLSNVLDLDATQDSPINALVPWRDYLVAASNNAIYLINRVEGGFTSKVINTFTGVSEEDKNSLMSILNGLLFKNGDKLFALTPNANSGVDSILSISEISKPIGNLLDIEATKILAFSTESYYGLFLTITDKTYLLKYDYGTRNYTLMEYPVEIVQVFIDSVQSIIVTDKLGKQYYFNKDLTADKADLIGYGDILATEYANVNENTVITPITFEIDSGEKSDDMGFNKNFVETRIAFGLQSEQQSIPLTVSVYADGHKQIIHKAVETDAAFWSDQLSDLSVLNTDLTASGSQIINTLKEFRLRHTGIGKTIRHVITGNSLTKFKLYVIYYKYRYLPGEE
jgi:hypothetical protein